jgi:hypothetical protein
LLQVAGRLLLSYRLCKLHLATRANRRTAEYRTAEFRRVVSFHIRHSLFDIRYSFFEVSRSIKLAALAANG